MSQQVPQSALDDSDKFTCSISVANAKYSISEDVLPWIMFVLSNKSETTSFYVLKWNTPLEGFRNNFLEVYCNKEKLTYKGMMVKRGDPEKTDYDLLLPGSSLSASVYLGEAYDVSKPGVYHVELNTSLADVIQDNGGDFEPHKINDFQGQKLRCERLVFEIAV